MSDRLSKLFKLQHGRKECSKCSNASFFLKFTSNLLVRRAFFLLNGAFAMAILDLTVGRSPRISRIRVTFDRLFPWRCNKCARVLLCSCLCCSLKACGVGFVILISFVWLLERYMSRQFVLDCVWNVMTRADTRFRPSANWTSPFKSPGASVQWTTGRRGMRISDSTARYTMFRGSVKLPTPLASFPFTSPPVRHRAPSHFNCSLLLRS
jgi:hypothetical protein